MESLYFCIGSFKKRTRTRGQKHARMSRRLQGCTPVERHARMRTSFHEERRSTRRASTIAQGALKRGAPSPCVLHRRSMGRGGRGQVLEPGLMRLGGGWELHYKLRRPPNIFSIDTALTLNPKS